MAQTDHAGAADQFDYVIVGSGAAGAILANRLTEDGKTSVCLLEAGPMPERTLRAYPRPPEPGAART